MSVGCIPEIVGGCVTGDVVQIVNAIVKRESKLRKLIKKLKKLCCDHCSSGSEEIIVSAPLPEEEG
jgi:hypothetical protein